MKILELHGLNTSKVKASYQKILQHLKNGDFAAAQVKKLTNHQLYRAKLNDADRLLFTFATYQAERYLLILEVIYQHEYRKARFLRNYQVSEEDFHVPTGQMDEVNWQASISLKYVNSQQTRFHYLDRPLSFDQIQETVLYSPLPAIIIGPAGSGKTALTLERMKQLTGKILYLTLSAFLCQKSREIYFSNGYDNEQQEVEFLTLEELYGTIQVPSGQEINFTAFAKWFLPLRTGQLGLKELNAHQLFEEFTGVLTGSEASVPYLSAEAYLALGVRQSIFPPGQRPIIYQLFEKYLSFLKTNHYYEKNLLAYQLKDQVQPLFTAIVIDEIQDFTNAQLAFALGFLREKSNFLLCGDSNQIVHPNFFSWPKLKSMFYLQGDLGQQVARILATNYRNAKKVTELANQLLRLKNVRFGSIDKESHYLMESVATSDGKVEILKSTPSLLTNVNKMTKKSTKYAVIVLREEDKQQAEKYFQTPLLFTVQEAKGLEYPHIILYNFINNAARPFSEIASGLTAADLTQEFNYARAKDKADKSLEIYKFYINALYVAITRAISEVMIIDEYHQHPLYQLLLIKETSEKQTVIVEEVSSLEEWQKEAARLEMQGKKEQAEKIRREILHLTPVPWQVLHPENLKKLQAKVFNRQHFDKKEKQLLYEYAVVNNEKYLFPKLVNEGKFKRAETPKNDLYYIQNKYFGIIEKARRKELMSEINKYGVNYLNPLGFTPLMIAAQCGDAELVAELLDNGAQTHFHDNFGRQAIHLALLAALKNSDFAQKKFPAIYHLLAKWPLILQFQQKMIKLDPHLAEYQMMLLMIAKTHDNFWEQPNDLPATFQSADFLQAFNLLPTNVIAPHRQKRPYLSSVLAKNEINGTNDYNRFLFIRVMQGNYFFNPQLSIKIDDQWIKIGDYLGLDFYQHHQSLGRQRLLKFLAH